LARDGESSPDLTCDPEDGSSEERWDGNERISRFISLPDIGLNESWVSFLDLMVPDETPSSFR